MKSSFIAAVIAAAITVRAPAFTYASSAQPAYGSSTSVRQVEALVGAAAGATVAVLLWPAIAPGAAAEAAGSAAIGALIGGAVGYFEFEGAFQSAGGD